MKSLILYLFYPKKKKEWFKLNYTNWAKHKRRMEYTKRRHKFIIKWVNLKSKSCSWKKSTVGATGTIRSDHMLTIPEQAFNGPHTFCRWPSIDHPLYLRLGGVLFVCMQTAGACGRRTQFQNSNRGKAHLRRNPTIRRKG